MSYENLEEYIEDKFKVKFIGFYDIPHPTREFEGVSDIIENVYVFWQENPDVSKGHSNYLGVIDKRIYDENVLLINAKGIEKAEYNAIEVDKGNYIVSRYRHDKQEGPKYRNSYERASVDGGLDYCHYNPKFPITHKMIVRNGKEEFIKIDK